MVQEANKNLLERCRAAGGVKPVAIRAGMRPGTLSNKISGWSTLFPEERRRVLRAIEELCGEQESQHAAA